MKIFKPILFLTFVLVTLFSCNNEPVDFTLEENPNLDNNDIKWWVLVHPVQGNEGIYLYNETTTEIERKIDLPEDFISPGAIDFYGDSIWVSGAHGTNSIIEINPSSGEVINEIELEAPGAMGLVVSEQIFYVSNLQSIYLLDRQGNFQELILDTGGNVIQDLAYKDQKLYYIFNNNSDPIVKLNLSDNTQNTIIELGTFEVSTNLAIRDNDLIMVTESDQIRRLNIETGEIISETALPIPIEGSIVSITPYN